MATGPVVARAHTHTHTHTTDYRNPPTCAKGYINYYTMEHQLLQGWGKQK